MAELGWTRDRLETATTADVEAARVIVYARHWRSFLARDLKAEIEDLKVADSNDAKLQERHEHRRRLQAIEDLKEGAPIQAAVREVLLLEARD